MPVIACLNISDFIKCFAKNPTQINKLLSTSFPGHFSNKGVTIFDHLDMLVKYNKINNADVVTFVKLIGEKVIVFAQVVYEKNPSKLRVINLCRTNSNQYKGQGAKMLKCIIRYFNSTPSHFAKRNKLYLSVGATKQSLQMYYKALGWKDTYRYDIQSDVPSFEFVYNLNR